VGVGLVMLVALVALAWHIIRESPES